MQFFLSIYSAERMKTEGLPHNLSCLELNAREAAPALEAAANAREGPASP